MNLWSTQKVGQSVVDTNTVVPASGTEVKVPFKKVLVGAGYDERPLYGTTVEDEEEINNAALSRIDKSLRQKMLLQGLSSGYWSVAEKAERVRLAAYDNLLPTSFASEVVSISNLQSGGLTKDWDF